MRIDVCIGRDRSQRPSGLLRYLRSIGLSSSISLSLLAGLSCADKEAGRNATLDDSKTTLTHESPSTPEVPVVVEAPPRKLGPEEIQAKQLALENEIARLGLEHPWAGEFTTVGTDTTSRLLVAPEAGYLMSHSGRRGPWVSDLGRASFEGGRVVLVPDPAFDSGRAGFDLIPVPWGERTYLLQADRVIDFCNRVNSGREASDPSRAEWIRCRAGGVASKPELPAEFRSLVLEAPIEGRVLEKLPRKGENYPAVVLDVGRIQGVFEGMKLLRAPYDGSLMLVESVQEATCVANCRGGAWFSELPLGATFSTAMRRE